MPIPPTNAEMYYNDILYNIISIVCGGVSFCMIAWCYTVMHKCKPKYFKDNLLQQLGSVLILLNLAVAINQIYVVLRDTPSSSVWPVKMGAILTWVALYKYIMLVKHGCVERKRRLRENRPVIKKEE